MKSTASLTDKLRAFSPTHGGEILPELAPVLPTDGRRPVLVFFDTEFTDFINCDLISIGLVTESGEAKFYGERNDFRVDWCSDAVRFNILPMLGGVPSLSRAELRAELDHWIRSLDGHVQFLCDSSTDWELLVDLFDGTLPSIASQGALMTEVRTRPEFSKAVYAYHSAPDHPWHHALHDACASRAGWVASQSL